MAKKKQPIYEPLLLELLVKTQLETIARVDFLEMRLAELQSDIEDVREAAGRA